MSSSQHPVVLRFEGMRPEQLARFEQHRLRKQKGREEVDPRRKKLNRLLIGEETWAKDVLAEIDDMRMGNFALELQGLERRKRKKEMHDRLIEGPKDPWRPSKHGPMREVVLTANAEYFAGDDDQSTLAGMIAKARRERMFERVAVNFLQQTFGDDVVHARCDRDEKTYHIHAVIVPRSQDRSGRRVLQPSKHATIKDYELAQDVVAHWFSDLDLRRGEKRAEAARFARWRGEDPPEPVHHMPTWRWRQTEAARLQREHEQQLNREAALTWREEQVADAARQVAAKSAAADTKAKDADRRDAAAAVKERAAAGRIAQADAREAEADAVLAVAEGIASGAFEIDDATDAPTVAPSRDPAKADAVAALSRRANRSNKATRRAAGIFGRAWRVLRRRADAAAERKLAKEFASVETARQAVATVAVQMPPNLRKGLDGAMRKLGVSVTAAAQVLRKRERPAPPQGRDEDGMDATE